MRLQCRNDVLEDDVVRECGFDGVATGATAAVVGVKPTTTRVGPTVAALARLASGQVEGKSVGKHECRRAHAARVALLQMAEEEVIVVARIYDHRNSCMTIKVRRELHGDDFR